MTTALFFQLYFGIFAIFTPINEHWNYHNPRPYPMNKYILLNWEKADFSCFNISKECILLKHRDTDNKYKARARREYWDRLEHFEQKNFK